MEGSGESGAVQIEAEPRMVSRVCRQCGQPFQAEAESNTVFDTDACARAWRVIHPRGPWPSVNGRIRVGRVGAAADDPRPADAVRLGELIGLAGDLYSELVVAARAGRLGAVLFHRRYWLSRSAARQWLAEHVGAAAAAELDGQPSDDPAPADEGPEIGAHDVQEGPTPVTIPAAPPVWVERLGPVEAERRLDDLLAELDEDDPAEASPGKAAMEAHQHAWEAQLTDAPAAPRATAQEQAEEWMAGLEAASETAEAQEEPYLTVWAAAGQAAVNEPRLRELLKLGSIPGQRQRSQGRPWGVRLSDVLKAREAGLFADPEPLPTDLVGAEREATVGVQAPPVPTVTAAEEAGLTVDLKLELAAIQAQLIMVMGQAQALIEAARPILDRLDRLR